MIPGYGISPIVPVLTRFDMDTARYGYDTTRVQNNGRDRAYILPITLTLALWAKYH